MRAAGSSYSTSHPSPPAARSVNTTWEEVRESQNYRQKETPAITGHRHPPTPPWGAGFQSPVRLAGHPGRPCEVAGSGTAASQRCCPCLHGADGQHSLQPLLGAWQPANGTAAEKGEPPAQNLQKAQSLQPSGCLLHALLKLPVQQPPSSRGPTPETHAARCRCKSTSRRLERGRLTLVSTLHGWRRARAEAPAARSPRSAYKDRPRLESSRRRAKKRLSNFALGASEDLRAGPPARWSHTRNF